jgi:hypothetical protein
MVRKLRWLVNLVTLVTTFEGHGVVVEIVRQVGVRFTPIKVLKTLLTFLNQWMIIVKINKYNLMIRRSKMKSIFTKGPNGGIKVYTSAAATSRALSGTGSSTLRSSISRAAIAGGGIVNGTFVKFAK